MKQNLTFLFALAIAWLANTGAMALERVEGVYQIGTADQLIEFAAIVNGGENGANAILTADIDMTGKTWTPIGDNDHRYVGTFDGQYHKIDNLKIEGESKIGIFGVVNGGCVIKNLVAGPNNEVRGTSMIGGIIGCSDGSGWVTLENVGHEGYVYGTGNNCCAIFGVIMNGGPATRMTNCYNTGNISAGGESAIITGWFGGHGSVEVRGFWNTGIIENGGDGDNSLWRNSTGITTERIYHLYAHQGASVIEDSDLASGRLAYQLNGNVDAGIWRQNLSEPKDAYPTFDPSHGFVYANGALQCDGVTAKVGSEVTYSNTEGSTRDEHQFQDGICTVCGELFAVDGVYQLGCADALVRYSEIVRTSNGAANAVLTDDIDMTGKEWTPIGQDAHDFKGHFNGQGHRILKLTTNAGQNNQALFGQAVGGAIIENVIIDASCIIQGNAFTAGILGHVWGDGVIVCNCGNEADIMGTAQNSAGIVGCSEKQVTIENCYNTGTIVGSHENAGICAWMGNNESVIRNCYSTAVDINGNPLWRKDEVQGENVYAMYGGQGQLFTAEQMASGELAYKLNGNSSENVVWFQKLGEGGDAHPMPFGTEVVYANGSNYCDGTPKPDMVYENEEKGVETAPHKFSEATGLCENSHDGIFCHEPNPAFKETAEGGYYELSNFTDLNWFASLVNKLEDYATAKAKLSADIEMDSSFPCIGTTAHRFVGEIDGQKHLIKGWTIEDTANPVALVRYAGAGITLKNMTMDSSNTLKGHHASAAFIGDLSGHGEVTLECLGNEAAITTDAANAGGIIGCNYSGDAHITMTNCYNAGQIQSGWEAGGLSGWLGNDAVTVNCYNMGEVINGESFARGNNIQITNCFDPVTDWPALPKSPIEDFTNGTIFEKLAEAAPGIWYLSAEENGHPVLYNTGIITGIQDVRDSNSLENGNVYDLQGHKVNASGMNKGIYIKNGKKIIF